MHRLTDDPATVYFACAVNLMDLDGSRVLARGVKRWEPDLAKKHTAVVFYEPSGE